MVDKDTMKKINHHNDKTKTGICWNGMVSIPQQDVLGEVRIQRTATSMVPDLEDQPYLERLKELIKIKRLKIKRHDSLDIINYNRGMWKHTSLDLCHESVFVSVFFYHFVRESGW